ncbi:hypothetical protein GCM10010211_58080 [Streptomyces albospinus]|uniref:Uncharacterized protein n=1 Tax=Streptomyces albospinus TaxID=285515 RepID=A0ABQ2VHL2_9ACTN|nr:hypothetical protein [Streptomyces albospinus]GGU84489.1 hypothetical protein GCM10010211_58080 [Streptomyces albospinus]
MLLASRFVQDVGGAVTSAVTPGMAETINYGWASSHTPGFGTGALVPLLAFVVRQAKAANPLLPLRVFRSRNASGATGVQALMTAGTFSFPSLCVLHWQKVLGFGEFHTPGSGPRPG